MWNDTDIPLAYLITFRTYGSWLHGDERGSIDRYKNSYNAPYLPAENAWLERNTEKLKSAPVKLNERQRLCVDSAIRECCSFRQWDLFAVNVRTNHAHIVVATGLKSSGIALGAFKANATREMRGKLLWTEEHSPWADKGSRRKLWNQDHITNAVDYVL